MPGSQPSTATTTGAGGGTSCCETGRVVATDPVTGQPDLTSLSVASY